MRHPILLCTLVLLLGACGGGGGGSSAPATKPAATTMTNQATQPQPQKPAPDPSNQPPVAPDVEVQLTDWEAFEGVLPGSDPDGDAITFSIPSAFVPIRLTDPATGAYRYEPLTNTRSGEVEYRITDAHGAVDYGIITFLHALTPVVAPGECPIPQAGFGEPVANVWTHPDDSVLFIGFGDDQIVNMRRFELVASGSPVIGPAVEETAAGSARLGAVRELLVDPDDTDTLYARIDFRDVAVSHDLGITWSYLDHPGFGLEIDDLAVTGGRDGYLWAVNGTGVYRAARDDLEFLPVLTFGEAYGERSIAAHPDRPERVIVANGDGTYLTEDAGETWTLIAQAPDGRLVSDPHDPERLYANGFDTVHLSTDFGQTWSQTGFRATASELLVPDPFRRGRLYIAPYAYSGLRVSDDEGAHFELVDELPEPVRGIAFTSTGALYATQGDRLVCRPFFELPAFDPDHPLAVAVEIQNPTSGEPVAEVPVLTPLSARVRIQNRAGHDLDDVEIAAWLTSPDGRRQIYGTRTALPSAGIDLSVDLPPLEVAYQHRLLVTADLPDTAPVGALAWVATTKEAPPQVSEPDYAVLTHSMLYLNYADPWFPIVTEPGEQRRMVLDVENEGPATARNVLVQIGTGTSLSIDEYGPMSIGQALDCIEDATALTCRLGDMAPDTVQSIELFVTPHTTLFAVPVSVSSDTPSFGVPSGGLDVVPEIQGPTAFVPGETLEYRVAIHNIGDEQARSYVVSGVIGPWPVVTDANVQLLDGPRCAQDWQYDSLTYRCDGEFLNPGETGTVTIQITAPGSATAVHHVVTASGWPSSSSSRWMESFTGNNSAGVVSLPSP